MGATRERALHAALRRVHALFLRFAAAANLSQWHAWLARPSTSVAFLVFFTALLGHMWVGLRDVLLDYAKPASLRRSLLAAIALGLLGLGAWVLSILLRLQA